MGDLLEQDLTGRFIAAAVRVHQSLGPGLLESAYEACLYHALTSDGLLAERQVAMPVVFEGAC